MNRKKSDFIFKFSLFSTLFCIISDNIYLKILLTTILVILYFSDKKIIKNV